MFLSFSLSVLQDVAQCVTPSQYRFGQGFLKKTSSHAPSKSLPEASFSRNKRNGGEKRQTIKAFIHELLTL